MGAGAPIGALLGICGANAGGGGEGGVWIGGICAAARTSLSRESENRFGIFASTATFLCGLSDFNSARNSGVTTFSGKSTITVSFWETVTDGRGLIQVRTAFQGNAILPSLMLPSTAPKGSPTTEVCKWCDAISPRTLSGHDSYTSEMGTDKNLVSPANAGIGTVAGIGALKGIGSGSDTGSGAMGVIGSVD